MYIPKFIWMASSKNKYLIGPESSPFAVIYHFLMSTGYNKNDEHVLPFAKHHDKKGANNLTI